MRWIVALLLIGVMMAGCAEEPVVEEEETKEECVEGFCGQDVAEGEHDLRIDLTADDSVAAPKWQVGDVFQQHMFFGKNDASGRHIETMVVEADNGYTVATTEPAAARFEAVYDYPILGRIGPGLETTAFGADWSWMYAFPIEDGKTWTGEVDDLINWNTYSFSDFELTMTARYDAAIDTPHGDYPGFWIDAMTADGEAFALYNYVPAVGWFSHMWIYDLDSQDPDDIMFHAMSMGTSKNYTGPYYTAEAETLVEKFFGVFPDPEHPQDSGIEGDPAPIDFTFPDDAEAIMGVAVPIAFPGRTEIHLVAPDGREDKYIHEQANIDDRGFSVYWIDGEPKPGEWQARFVTAGVVSGFFLWLEAVDLERMDL